MTGPTGAAADAKRGQLQAELTAFDAVTTPIAK